MSTERLSRFAETVVATVDEVGAHETPSESPERLGRLIALMALDQLDDLSETPECLARRTTLAALERQGG